MKKRHLLAINVMFFGLVAFSASVVYQFMTGSSIWSFAQLFAQSSSQKVVKTDQCSAKKPFTDLATVENTSIRKLATYQQACHSYVTNTIMVFLSMPSTASDALRYAQEDAKILKAFQETKLRPLVIAEPTTKTGTNLDYELFANGTYSPAIDAYFSELKKQGLTTNDLGIWNPFPEANLPYWENNHPQFFSPAMNNYLTIARQHFPKLTTSVMLNSATYETTDFNWENGDYNSLLPYIKDIKPGLIDYAGIQGFPWISRQGGRGVIFNAAEFLNPPLLTEMADKLGTKKIWFNTGTFSSKYTLDPEQIRHVSSGQRKEILLTIKDQALLLKKKGYDMHINIFAEDKSDQTEETNWSYWKPNQPFSSADAVVLTDFIHSLDESGIPFWLFDR